MAGCEHLIVKETATAYGSRLWTRDSADEAPDVGDFDIDDEETNTVECHECGLELDSNFLVTGEVTE